MTLSKTVWAPSAIMLSVATFIVMLMSDPMLNVVIPSVIMLSVAPSHCYAESHYSMCRYAECRYPECRCAECLGAAQKWSLREDIDKQHLTTLVRSLHEECHYAEHHDYLIVMLSVVMLNVVAPYSTLG
jgi:hypothetical protein